MHGSRRRRFSAEPAVGQDIVVDAAAPPHESSACCRRGVNELARDQGGSGSRSDQDPAPPRAVSGCAVSGGSGRRAGSAPPPRSGRHQCADLSSGRRASRDRSAVMTPFTLQNPSSATHRSTGSGCSRKRRRTVWLIALANVATRCSCAPSAHRQNGCHARMLVTDSLSADADLRPGRPGRRSRRRHSRSCVQIAQFFHIADASLTPMPPLSSCSRRDRKWRPRQRACIFASLSPSYRAMRVCEPRGTRLAQNDGIAPLTSGCWSSRRHRLINRVVFLRVSGGFKYEIGSAPLIFVLWCGVCPRHGSVTPSGAARRIGGVRHRRRVRQ